MVSALNLKSITSFFAKEGKPADSQLQKQQLPEVEGNDELELFAYHFSQNGGKLLVCNGKEEILESIQNISLDSGWKVFNIFHETFSLWAKQSNVTINSDKRELANFPSLIGCEYLLCDGRIIVSSHQTGGYQSNELSSRYVILAHPSQVRRNIDEAMQNLKERKQGQLPSGITTLNTKIDGFSSSPKGKEIYLIISPEVAYG
jgi:hypothetical protein